MTSRRLWTDADLALILPHLDDDTNRRERAAAVLDALCGAGWPTPQHWSETIRAETARTIAAQNEAADLRSRVVELEAQRDEARAEAAQLQRPAEPRLTRNTRLAPCVDCTGLILVAREEAGSDWRCGRCAKNACAVLVASPTPAEGGEHG